MRGRSYDDRKFGTNFQCGLRTGGRSLMGGAWLDSSRPTGYIDTLLMILGLVPRDLGPTLSPLALGPKCGIDELSSKR